MDEPNTEKRKAPVWKIGAPFLNTYRPVGKVIGEDPAVQRGFYHR